MELDLLKKIGGFIKEFIGIIASIITIVALFQKNYKVAVILSVFLVFIFFILLLIPLIQVFRINRAENRIRIEVYKSEIKLGNKIHKFYHKLRDYSTNSNMNNYSNINELKKSCDILCASISEIMEQVFKRVLEDNTISTCVKIVNSDSLLDSSYENWMIETFGRSPSTNPERTSHDNEKVSLKDNTDFLAIVMNKDKFMCFYDMSDIYETFRNNYDLEYRNSRGKDFIKYYKSCIIVPIEIDGNQVSDEIKNSIPGIKNKKLILGFLCIDSMKVFNTEEELSHFKIAIEMAKALGDSLYIFLEKVLITQIRCKNIE